MNGERFLPDGPWPLRRGFGLGRTLGALLLAVVGCGVAAFFVDKVWATGAGLCTEMRIAAASDQRTVPAQFQGHESRSVRFGIPDIVGFSGATIEGKPVAVRTDLDLLWTHLADLPELAVVYPASDPQSMTTTWHLATRGERCVRAIGGTVVVGGLLAAVFWVAWRTWRRGRSAAAVAYDGIEVVAPARFVPARAWFGGQRWWLIAEWEVDGARCEHRIEQDPRRGPPVWVADGRVLLVVSRHSPRDVLVLRHRLWPLRLSSSQIDESFARIAATNPAPAATATA